jgi:hypothetical protein
MKSKEQILELIKVQDIIRLMYFFHDHGSEAENKLKSLDKDLTTVINLLFKMY